MTALLINLVYLVASAFFIIGLKSMARPRTAANGNILSAVGMLLAVVVTLFDRAVLSYDVILAGLVVGTAAGIWLAYKTQMTAMPQMIGMLNGFGGGASALVAGAALIEILQTTQHPSYQFTIATVASGIIGSVTFFGSMVAYGKLQGSISEKPFRYRQEQFVKIGLVVVSLLLGVIVIMHPAATLLYWLLVLVAGVLGVLLVISIGGADMPVVISLLNSYSGMAATATGFVLQNNLLIIAGSLVGASGIILTKIMCDAMNRSLLNVLFGGLGAVVERAASEDIYSGKVKSVSAEEIAMILETARQVVIIPGYGMAVAQAQHAVRDLYKLLEERGAEVRFAIHPVAGRMPGHMNVLLAEADIPYDKLLDLESSNAILPQTDVAIVIGANDVVNPSARTDPTSPIAGMPILDADKARTVVVIKRGLGPGFAGIPNPLFIAPNTLFLYGDGKQMIQELIAALKQA